MMRALLIILAVSLSAPAFAQSAAPPAVGKKTLAEVKPKAPMGCKLVGTVKGTKLWAGNCGPSESAGAAETPVGSGSALRQ
jgi:hypothetical protein